MSTDLGLDIAQSLTTIVILYRDLTDEAEHRYADKEFPGGDALVMLGPVANMEAYGYRQLSEMMGRTSDKAGFDDEEVDDAPPLLVLASWVDVLRDHRGLEPSEKRASITSEADTIRANIDWMLDEDHDGIPNFMPADELAKDLRRVVSRLENVLKAGRRAEFGAPCLHCREPLLREWDDRKGLLESYRCTACGRNYSKDQYDYAIGVTYLANATELTAEQIERREDIAATKVRVWGSRYDGLKTKRNPDGLWMYDVEAVLAKDEELRKPA